MVSVARLGFGEDAARGEIQAQLQDLMGEAGAGAVQGLLASVREPAEGLTATAVGLVLLLVGATPVFAELQDALDRIWRVPGRLRNTGWLTLVRARLMAFGMILAVGSCSSCRCSPAPCSLPSAGVWVRCSAAGRRWWRRACA